jgi:Nse1 non-SMC component of SMC5-6 complex
MSSVTLLLKYFQMAEISRCLSIPQQKMLQLLMASHTMTQEEAVKAYLKYSGADKSGQSSVEDCFRSINRHLVACFGLEIATVLIDGTKHHAVVNLNSEDDIAKASFTGTLPPFERDFIRKVLEAIVTSSNGFATRMSLINLRSILDPKFKVSIQDSELFLDRMVKERWLSIREEKGTRRASLNKTEYIIGPRAYLELARLLEDFGLEELPQCIYHRS